MKVLEVFDHTDGTLIGSSRSYERASEKYPNETRHARTQRAAFVHGYNAALRDHSREILTARELIT